MIASTSLDDDVEPAVVDDGCCGLSDFGAGTFAVDVVGVFKLDDEMEAWVVLSASESTSISEDSLRASVAVAFAFAYGLE